MINYKYVKDLAAMFVCILQFSLASANEIKEETQNPTPSVPAASEIKKEVKKPAKKGKKAKKAKKAYKKEEGINWQPMEKTPDLAK